MQVDQLVPAARLPRRKLTRSVQKRLDRLSRGAHLFHRYAHHPLCDRYSGEVVRIGPRMRLCRGCTYAVLGGVVGGAIGLVAGARVLALVAIGIAVIQLWSSMGAKRRSKLVTRLAPAALFGFAITGGGVVIAASTIAAAGALRLVYGKRGADRSPCTACPERNDSPCSGFRAIVSRERAIQRVARRLI